MGLAQCYESCFRDHGLPTAQVLLTHADMADRQRYLNARSTLRTLLGLGVIPVINENDTVVTDEIRFGDNDTLGALVTNLVEADALVILTDQEGLFDADPATIPGAKLVAEAHAGDPRLEEDRRRRRQRNRAGRHAHQGAGGEGAPLAAERTRSLLPGANPTYCCASAQGERLGTLLVAQTQPLAARKQWVADRLNVAGRLRLDAGAVKALVRNGKSLLPIGVIEVRGEFVRGEVVACEIPTARKSRAASSTIPRPKRAHHAPSLERDRDRPRATWTSPS
jgi:glutamate 5-kinase